MLIDVLHHLHRPLRFLLNAQKALKPSGRIVIFEPAGTPFAQFLWRTFHHEQFDLSQDPFEQADFPEPDDNGLTYSNMAISTIIFVRRVNDTLQRLQNLKIVRLEYSDFLVYPATGGFSHIGLIPAPLLPLLHKVENLLMRPFSCWLTGLRMLIVLQKYAEATTA